MNGSMNPSKRENRILRKQYRLALQILKALNPCGKRKDIIQDILLLIKDISDFEAVGIRIKDGEDYPYYVTYGFENAFVKAERYLCAQNPDGEIIRKSNGSPYLECMCGNVICGRTDPAYPFFTQGGSFWTNSTSELLAATSQEERQGRTRNRCHGEGYESVALIPLTYESTKIGLLQLNDPRKGLFTEEMIVFFEEIGNSIGIILERKKYQDQLKSLTCNLLLVEEQERRQISMDLHDQVGQLLAISKIKLGMLKDSVSALSLQEEIKEIYGYIDQTIQCTRSLIFEISPPVLYELGLKPALEWLTREVNKKHDVRILFKADDDQRLSCIDDTYRFFLYRATRELVINMVKHAKAKTAKISVQSDERMVRIIVEDDGVGFDPRKLDDYSGNQRGFGLFNIRERMENLGGYLTIEAARGKGSRFIIGTPLKINVADHAHEAEQLAGKRIG